MHPELGAWGACGGCLHLQMRDCGVCLVGGGGSRRHAHDRGTNVGEPVTIFSKSDLGETMFPNRANPEMQPAAARVYKVFETWPLRLQKKKTITMVQNDNEN